MEYHHLQLRISVKALKYKNDRDSPEVHKISKFLYNIKWTKNFKEYAHIVIGFREIPLSYLILDEVTPSVVAAPLDKNQNYSNKHESIDAEIIARTSHGHALFRGKN